MSPHPALIFLLPQLWAATWHLGPCFREHELSGESKAQALESGRTELGRHKMAEFYTFRHAKVQTFIFYDSSHLALALVFPPMPGKGVGEIL